MSLNSDMVQSFKAGLEITNAQRKRGGTSNRLCRRDLERYYRIVTEVDRNLSLSQEELATLGNSLLTMEATKWESFADLARLLEQHFNGLSNSEDGDPSTLYCRVARLSASKLVGLLDSIERYYLDTGSFLAITGLPRSRSDSDVWDGDVVQSFRAGPQITAAQRDRGGVSNRLCQRDLERYYWLIEREIEELPLSETDLGVLGIVLGEMEFREPRSFRMVPSLIREQALYEMLPDQPGVIQALPGKVDQLLIPQLVALVDEIEKRQVASGRVRHTKGFSKVRRVQEPVAVEA